MDIFFPFIHDPKTKKKEFEPEPLYIEVGPPPQKERKPDDEEQEERVVIIEL
jgi:hypothetical protein